MHHASTLHPAPFARLSAGLAFVFLVLVVFAVGLDQGQLLQAVGAGKTTWVHEFFHDGRHLFGFPCH